MVSSCIVPRCKRKRRTGLSYYRFPVKDAERCKLWLRAVNNPKYDEHTSVDCLKNHRVCSLHFKPEDFQRHLVWDEMGGDGVKKLRPTAVPSLNLGDGETSTNAEHSPVQVKVSARAAQAFASVVSGSNVTSVLPWTSVITSGPSTSSQASSLDIQCTGVDMGSPSPSQPIPISSGPPNNSHKSPPPAKLGERLCSVSSVDHLNESIHQETEFELSSTPESKSDENTEKDLSQSKTIVNDSCLMELFNKCQTCGQTIIKKKVSHCGAQKKVRWSCLGGHQGIWMSSPHLWETFPEIHLLTTLSILFSGATFTHFKKWAKHLHLNFMGNKTFFEIQKAYLNTEMKQMNRTEQEAIYAKGDQQQPEGALLHIADDGCYVSPEPISTRSEQYPLKKIKAKLRRREKRALSSQSSYKERFPISRTSTGASVQEPSSCGHVSTSEIGEQHRQDNVEYLRTTTHKVLDVNCHSSFEEMEVTIEEDEEEECNSVDNGVSELESDMENVLETPELRAAEADDNCNEGVYVPVIPQRSTTSALLLECEEEELEPWQQQTSQVDLKDEDDVRELTDEERDCKMEPSTPPTDIVNTSPELKTENLQPVIFNNPGLIVASPQLTSRTEVTSPLGTQCPLGNSLTVVPAVHHQLFHKVTGAIVTSEAYGMVPSSEVQQISNSPVSLPSLQAPAVYAMSSNHLQFNQPNALNLPASVTLPCVPYLNLTQLVHPTNNK